MVPEENVLLVAGTLEGGARPILVKIKGLGGGGQNMFALTPDGGSVNGYSYRIGSQNMNVRRISYQDGLQIDNGVGTVYVIRGTGGSGYNMFALVNDNQCESLPNYNYFIKGTSKNRLLTLFTKVKKRTLRMESA